VNFSYYCYKLSFVSLWRNHCGPPPQLWLLLLLLASTLAGARIARQSLAPTYCWFQDAEWDELVGLAWRPRTGLVTNLLINDDGHTKTTRTDTPYSPGWLDGCSMCELSPLLLRYWRWKRLVLRVTHFHPWPCRHRHCLWGDWSPKKNRHNQCC